MSDKKTANIQPSMHPSPKVIVSCRGKNGENNALVVAYCGNCSYDPPMLMMGIVPSRHSHAMVKETGCFVVNLVEKGFRETFDYLGSVSGRDEDKLKTKQVRVADGDIVNAPMLMDCPVNIECTVVDSIRTGSHEMFIGKIERIHARPDLVDAEGKLDLSSLDLI